MASKQPTEIDTLPGEVLSTVAFVWDYVEFHFDGKILRSLANPSVTVGTGTVTFPEAGARDALCTAIGRAVEKVDIDETDHIALIFAGGVVIRIPLRASARSGPEAAHFVPGKNRPIEVW